MSIKPQIRILVRYIVGLILGYIAATNPVFLGLDNPEIAETLTVVTVGLLNEIWYMVAKRTGGAT